MTQENYMSDMAIQWQRLKTMLEEIKLILKTMLEEIKMRMLERDIKVACVGQDTTIANRLAHRYKNTQVYVGSPEGVLVSRQAGNRLAFTGLRGLDNSSIPELHPDVLLLDSDWPEWHHHAPVEEFTARYLKTYQEILPFLAEFPVLSILPNMIRRRLENESSLLELLERPVSDCVFSHEDVSEVHFRMARLIGICQRNAAEARPKQPDGRDDVERLPRIVASYVPELRNDSGRLDAKKVSEMFGINMSELATILGREKSTLSKTPAAESLQVPLHVYERIAAMLLHLSKDPSKLRMWMNAPNRTFRNQPPIQFLRDGLGNIVADRLENALTGQLG